MGQALLVTLTYYVLMVLDSIQGMQTIQRPIILGTVTGLVCGDLKTGIIMGAQLEAVFMGVSAIGGVVATDTKTSTVMCTAFVILSGIPLETGMALAATVGALINSLSPLKKAFWVMFHPLFVKLANEGNVKAFRRLMWIDMLTWRQAIDTLILFFCLYLGTDAVAAFVNVIPKFVLTGMNAAAGMLVVVGFALTTQAIWTSYTPVYVIIGFVCVKYLGLNTTAVALIGLAIALLAFKGKKELIDATARGNTSASVSEGDDFYE